MVPRCTASCDNGGMPIHHFLVLLLVALAAPLQSALAACQCFQETATSPEFGYLELFPVPCTSTPPNHGWLKVPPDGNGNPSPPMYVALRSSRNLSGMVLLYSGEWSPGVPRVVLTACLCCSCSNQPPPLMFDFQPPDSERPGCPSTTYGTYGVAFNTSCYVAESRALQIAKDQAAATCGAAGLCGATTQETSCTRLSWKEFAAEVSYSFQCFGTVNLCQ